MTTIACDRKSIACDRMVTYGGQYKFRAKTKIRLLEPNDIFKEPAYIGWSGALEPAHSILEWLHNPTGRPPKTNNNCNFLLLTQKGRIFTFQSPNPANWVEVDEPFFAIGSGTPTAIGAMVAGADPKGAIEAASKVDIYTGMGVKVYEF